MTTTLASPAPPKKLRRDKGHALLGGVCAGIARYFDLDIALVRVAYVLISIFTAFAGILVYVVLWIIIPAKPAPSPRVAPPPAPPAPPPAAPADPFERGREG